MTVLIIILSLFLGIVGAFIGSLFQSDFLAALLGVIGVASPLVFMIKEMTTNLESLKESHERLEKKLDYLINEMNK